MNKKMMIAVSGLAVLSNAFAADLKDVRVKMDWRFDMIKQNFDSTGYPANTPLTNAQNLNNEGNDFRFTIPYVRLDIGGKATEDISYKLKFRLNKTSELSTPDVDSTSQFLDYAYIDKKLMDNLTLRIGKQALYHGGWEAMPSSRDQYSYSTPSFTRYSVGVGAWFYPIEGQEIIFQVMNNKYGENNQKNPLYGGQYHGKFLNGLLEPIASYHVEQRTKQLIGGTQPGTASTALTAEWKDAKEVYMSVGNRVNVGEFNWDFDYLRNTADSYNALTRDATDTAYTTTLQYGENGHWRPQVKYAYSIDETINNNDRYRKAKRQDYHAILEYYPDVKSDIRFHGGYIAGKIEPKTVGTDATTRNDAKTTDQTFVIGMAGAF